MTTPTPKALGIAEKIADDLWKDGPHSHLNPKQIDKIAHAIDAACAEADEKGQVKGFDKGYSRGFSDARERAAKVCEWIGPNCPSEREFVTMRNILTEQIRTIPLTESPKEGK